jgi:hypothetical protein
MAADRVLAEPAPDTEAIAVIPRHRIEIAAAVLRRHQVLIHLCQKDKPRRWAAMSGLKGVIPSLWASFSAKDLAFEFLSQ